MKAIRSHNFNHNSIPNRNRSRRRNTALSFGEVRQAIWANAHETRESL